MNNHPQREDWIEFIHDEASPESAERLRQHLAHCPLCAAQVASWRRVVQSLPSWRLPEENAPAQPVAEPVTRLDFAPNPWPWRAVAALAVGAAFLAGMVLSSHSGDVNDLRREIAGLKTSLQTVPTVNAGNADRFAADLSAVKASLGRLEQLYSAATNDTRRALAAVEAVNRAGQQALMDLAASDRAAREQDRAAFANILKESEYRQENRVALLRRDLETVASMADDQLESTRQNLIRISSVYRTSHPQP